MATEVVAASSQGTLSSIGSSLANVGTVGKAFALAHPMGMAAAGGALLGFGIYHTTKKMFNKKEVEAPAQIEAETVPAEAATA